MAVEFRGKRVLVTGSNGFVGGHLVKQLLALGAEVTGVLRASSDRWRFRALGISPDIVTCDLTDTARLDALLRPLRPQFVYHLAAERAHDTLALADTQGRSACSGADVMRAVMTDSLSRFISVGSALEVPDPETGEVIDLHGRSKARELLSMQIMAEKLNIPFTPTRTHYVYGPLQSENKLVPVAIRAALQGHALTLTGPEIRKRYIYVQDLVSALLQVPELPVAPDEVQLITSPQQVRNDEVVGLISRLTGRPVRITPDRFPARVFDRNNWDLTYSGTPMPDWQVSTSLLDGLRACIGWEAEALV